MSKEKIPSGFRYQKVLEKGRPAHEKTDPFRIRHPAMPCAKRAKIFAPFDALRGFGDMIREAESQSEKDAGDQQLP